MRLIEAASLPILLVDERIQDAVWTQMAALWKPGSSATATREPSATVGEALALAGTYVIPLPRVEEALPSARKSALAAVELEAGTAGRDVLQDVVVRSARAIARKTGRLPLLVIHQGLLDTSGLAMADRSKAWFDHLVGRTGTAVVVDVIVTSGRGIPENLPHGARFVPLSSLLTYTTRRRSKYHLVQLLMSARKAHNA